ncbi:phage holin family protein [Halomonas sp. GD1P12]|uniref:phage holin family protein n=1 Tax=Halomonas sp. GD1P12 TaxID=2982691 RepID=UPI0021E43FA8|nr:phage holin family protein [Halomonas sp. GD1P12]UYF99323.1 phage holin family protein [Halomonas sp. GD1P12]
MTIAYAITLGAALIVIARLLTFRRRAGRYRPGVAFTAWAIIAVTTCLAIFGPPPNEVARWLIAAAMVALAIGLLRTGGNVAHLIRPLRRL